MIGSVRMSSAPQGSDSGLEGQPVLFEAVIINRASIWHGMQPLGGQGNRRSFKSSRFFFKISPYLSCKISHLSRSRTRDFIINGADRIESISSGPLYYTYVRNSPPGLNGILLISSNDRQTSSPPVLNPHFNRGNLSQSSSSEYI